jgi:toxin ParE1/3/4
VRLVITEPAARDLDGIVDYIARDNPTAAKKVFRAIAATSNRLCTSPAMGRTGRLPNTREFPVTNLPYLIVYEVGADTITILAVFHGARDLPRLFAERKKELKQ